MREEIIAEMQNVFFEEFGIVIVPDTAEATFTDLMRFYSSLLGD